MGALILLIRIEEKVTVDSSRRWLIIFASIIGVLIITTVALVLFNANREVSLQPEYTPINPTPITINNDRIQILNVLPLQRNLTADGFLINLSTEG